MSICWGAIDYGKGNVYTPRAFMATKCRPGYDLANQTAYLDDMLRWSLDWLIKVRALVFAMYISTNIFKAHPSDSTLYVQVADGSLPVLIIFAH